MVNKGKPHHSFVYTLYKPTVKLLCLIVTQVLDLTKRT
jgi:hypothetical protein